MEFLIIIGLILLNGFFSMSEIAIVSARRSRLMSESKLGSKSAQSALKLAEDPNRFLSTVQIGITLIGILTGIYSGAVFSNSLAVILEDISVSPAYSHFIAQASIVIVVTYLTIVFGELIPKRIGMSAASKVAKIIARPMTVLSIIASPFVWLLSQSTALVSRMIGLKDDDNQVTEDEIKSMIQEGTTTGEVQAIEQDIVERVFNLGDRDIESIMTNRHEIVWIDVNMSKQEIVELVKNEPFITYPVGDKDISNIQGIISLKDLFSEIVKDDFTILNIVKPALILHEKIEVYKALDQMRVNQNDYGLVCDEFGVIQGVVTYKDILEGLVGELPDMHTEPSIVKREDGGWLVDGQCEFFYFLEYFEKEDLYSTNKYNTVSGLILSQLGRIPHTGEILIWNDLHIEIIDMDGARIDKLLVNKLEEVETEAKNDD